MTDLTQQQKSAFTRFVAHNIPTDSIEHRIDHRMAIADTVVDLIDAGIDPFTVHDMANWYRTEHGFATVHIPGSILEWADRIAPDA